MTSQCEHTMMEVNPVELHYEEVDGVFELAQEEKDRASSFMDAWVRHRQMLQRDARRMRAEIPKSEEEWLKKGAGGSKGQVRRANGAKGILCQWGQRDLGFISTPGG